MNKETHHEYLVTSLRDQLGFVFEQSTQGIYLYKDDAHKICNQRLADMLGCSSIEEWVGVESLIDEFVAPESQEAVIAAYHRATEHYAASTIPVTLMRRDGRAFDGTVTFVPLAYEGHIMVLHFIEPYELQRSIGHD